MSGVYRVDFMLQAIQEGMWLSVPATKRACPSLILPADCTGGTLLLFSVPKACKCANGIANPKSAVTGNVPSC